MFRKLDPPLNEADMFDLIKTSTDCLFVLPNGPFQSPKSKDEISVRQIQDWEHLMSSSMDSLHHLLQEVLRKKHVPEEFMNVFKVDTHLFYSVDTFILKGQQFCCGLLYKISFEKVKTI